MRGVVVRLVLLAGAAAGTALFVREPLARRLSKLLDPSVQALAVEARSIVPPAAPVHEPVVATPPPAIAMLAPEKPIVVAKVTPKSTKKSADHPKPNAFVVSAKELEAGIAAHGWGARAVAVKDGLELHSVGKFARFGVSEGDVLVSANGYSLRTADDALAALGKLGDSRSIVVVLRRGEKSYAVPLELTPE
jgi:S1-C subfamily serine protease